MSGGINKLFRSEGSVAVCRGCGKVHEGTAGFAISHHDGCQLMQFYSLFVRLASGEGVDFSDRDLIADFLLQTIKPDSRGGDDPPAAPDVAKMAAFVHGASYSKPRTVTVTLTNEGLQLQNVGYYDEDITVPATVLRQLGLMSEGSVTGNAPTTGAITK